MSVNVERKKPNERILVVPNEFILPQLKRGVNPEALEGFDDLLARHGEFLWRFDEGGRKGVEGDPRFQQIVSYGVVEYQHKILAMYRTNQGGEERLDGAFNVGIGGHVTEEDFIPGQPFLQAVRREVGEELAATPGYTFHPDGLIKEPLTSVGRDHVGYGFTIRAVDAKFAVKETDKMKGWVATYAELRAMMPTGDSWSDMMFAYKDEQRRSRLQLLPQTLRSRAAALLPSVSALRAHENALA
jgi:predicted NUDIX family phosphoesterase